MSVPGSFSDGNGLTPNQTRQYRRAFSDDKLTKLKRSLVKVHFVQLSGSGVHILECRRVMR